MQQQATERWVVALTPELLGTVVLEPDAADLRLELAARAARLQSALADALAERRRNWQQSSFRLGRLSPRARLLDEQQRLDALLERARRAVQAGLAVRRARADGLHTRLGALSPLAVLRRGYALVQKPDGSLLRSASQAAPGDPLTLTLADGRLGVKVD